MIMSLADNYLEKILYKLKILIKVTSSKNKEYDLFWLQLCTRGILKIKLSMSSWSKWSHSRTKGRYS